MTESSPPPGRHLCDEPLAALARFSFDWAPSLCHPGHGCTNYHRAWSSVRLLESDGALPAGEAFFTANLRALARDGRVRVMLSGAADTGLMALVVRALRPAGIEPSIVLLDQCRTPLEQNRLYAQHLGVSIETHQGDAASFAGEEVDAVIAHSFLNFIPPASRPDVVGMWAKSLRKGGRLLVSQRHGSGGEANRARASDEDIAARCDTLVERAHGAGWSGDLVEELGKVAPEFWRISRHFGPLITEANMRQWLAEAGFSDPDIHYDGTSPSTSPFPLPSIAVQRPRAELAATKL